MDRQKTESFFGRIQRPVLIRIRVLEKMARSFKVFGRSGLENRVRKRRIGLYVRVYHETSEADQKKQKEEEAAKAKAAEEGEAEAAPPAEE